MTDTTAPMAQDATQAAIRALELAMNRLASNRSAAHYYGDGDLWDCCESAANGLRALAAAPAAAPRQPLTDDARDAARYRWLRDESNQQHEDDICVSDAFFTSYFGDDLDKAVDAAMGAPAPATGEQQ